MSKDLMDDCSDDSNQKESVREIEELQKKLVAICGEAGIEAEIKQFGAEGSKRETYVRVGMPNGREKRVVTFSNPESIERALALDFQKYVFLGDYIALANYEDSTIEAMIRPIPALPRSFLYRRLFGEDEQGGDLKPLIVKQNYPGEASIEIGKATEILELMARGPFVRRDYLSLKLFNIPISRHDRSLKLLRCVTDSLFFQIDIQNGLTLSLSRHRRPPRRLTSGKLEADIELEFPRVEFDESPISLYWYARSATAMPLLQFLAFYQVIEYYYPTYSREEARRRVRAILKDPAFRYERDADIGKILSIVAGTGRGFGDERSQLQATLNACLDPSDLRSFFEEDEERIEFFSSGQKGLTDRKIPLADKAADLRNATADLIYDIRCKIVHTKGEALEGDRELLLPFSKEAELLFHDIELLQYAASKVLVAASTPLSL